MRSEIDENGRTKTFEYDSNANITKERIDDIFRSYTYDAPQTQPPFIKDRVASYTNWRGVTTVYTNDDQGNKISEDIGGVQTAFTYDSRGLVIGINDFRGNNSILEYDALGQLISQTDGAGNQSLMTWDRRGRKTSETDASGNRTTFVYDNSDRIISKSLNDRLWSYGYQQGGLVKIETDPNDNTTEYIYDTMGRLLIIENAIGDQFTYTYDDNGNKLSENDFNGNQTTFAYDSANRLITKTEPLGKVTNYTYDAVGNVLTEATADRQASYGYDPKRYFLTAFTGEGAPESSGNKANKSNKADKMLTSAQTVRTVDGEGNILTETDPNGNLTTFTYDEFNRVVTETGPLGSGRAITYDGNGNILTETTYNNTGNQTRTYTYDGANRRISMVDAKGNTTTFSYFGNGNLKSENNPQGKQTTYEYNDLNLVTSKSEARGNGTPAIWTYTYDASGNLISETLPNGNIITTVYDALNRPISKTDQIGTISTFAYDGNSNIIRERDGNGNETVHTYNGLNQRITSAMPLNRGHSFTYTIFGELLSDTGPNGTIRYDVNVLGQRTSATGPDGYSERYDYDVNDNLTAFTDSRGTLTTYGINALNQTTSQNTGGTFNKAFSFDTLGNKLTETDYRGIQSQFTYDKENLQTSFTRADQLQNSTVYNAANLAQSETDANGNTRVHLYNRQYYRTQTTLPETQVIKYNPDEFGDVTMQDNPGANDISRVFDQRRRLVSETNGAGEQTQYEYDLNNNRTAVIKPNGARWEYSYDAANRLTGINNIDEAINTVYQYDNRDNLIKVIDAENKETSFTFDNRNRKLSKVYPDGQVVNYGYDNNGNLTSMSLPNGTSMTYQYDILNRKISESYSGSYGSGSVVYTLDGNGNTTQIEETIDGETFTTTQSFDDLDRMISRTDANGHTFGYQYDANGNRTNFVDHNNAITNYNFDGLNRLTQLSFQGIGTFDWDYNDAGLVKKIDYPNNTSVNYLYDNANRIKQINNKLMTADISSHSYEYDQNGNRTKLTESNIHINQVINYTYDRADRLRTVQYPNNNTTEYVLDKVGNRTQEIITGTNPNTKVYSYNSRDQLTNITDDIGQNISYSYDNAGNQLTKDDDGTVTTFDYTPRQRIKSITVGAAPPANYAYDYTGQRIRYRGNGEEKRYLYDGLTLIGQTNVLGNTIARYHYGDRYQLAETRHSRTNSYYHVDSLGTNVAITTVDGNIAARYEYDAYGNLLTQSGNSDQPFGFTGYQKDDDTGLYYANARYYDSNTGRFLREDPFDGDSKVPPSLHRYLYAFANPTIYSDPTGKCTSVVNMMNPTECDDLIKSFGDPEMARQIAFEREMEAAALLGIAQVGVDAVKGTFELAGQLSATLGEGFTGGYFYEGSAERFRNTINAVGNAISHPIETAKKAHVEHNSKVAAFEESGNHAAATKERSRYITSWVGAFFGAAKAVTSLKSHGGKVVTESTDNSLSFAINDSQLPKDWRLFIGAKLDSPKDKIGHTTIILQGPNGFQSVVGKWPRMESGQLGFDNVFDPIIGMKGAVLKERGSVFESFSRYAFKTYVIDVKQAKGAWKVIQDERQAVRNGTSRYQLFTDQCTTFGCSVIKGAGLTPPVAGIPQRPRKLYNSIMDEIYENYY